MIEKMIEEAFEGNYTSFSELFKEELGRRIHEKLEEKKNSVINQAYNVCEGCEVEEEEFEEIDDVEEEYGDDDHTMDPKSHVKKEGPNKFCVYDKDGKKIETFDNKKEAEAYAVKNHDDLMKEAYHSKKKIEAMDAVGKEDGDIDNDGDKDSSDKYLLKRRKAIGKAMKKEGSYGSKKSKSGGGY